MSLTFCSLLTTRFLAVSSSGQAQKPPDAAASPSAATNPTPQVSSNPTVSPSKPVNPTAEVGPQTLNPPPIIFEPLADQALSVRGVNVTIKALPGPLK
jgi:hypothetical protein